MFSNLIFLIIVLLLTTWAPLEMSDLWTISIPAASILGITLYFITLLIIYCQNRLFGKMSSKQGNQLLFLANLELVSFLITFLLLLGGHRLLTYLPLLQHSHFATALLSLVLYFGGLGLFYCTSFDRRNKLCIDTALTELKLLIPFAIPVLIMTFIYDVIDAIPQEWIPPILLANESLANIVIFVLTTLLLLGMMVFMPAAMHKIWQCRPLETGPLKARLENLCRQAHFKHAGLETWTVMNHFLTAAIIGVVPRFRYVIFSRRLLQEFPPSAIEAILAHEIGHSYRKHLWIYPFIIFGISICLALFSLVLGDQYFNHLQSFKLAALFVIDAILIALYFRYVFGLFSRLFERQADLHVFALAVPAQHLIEALILVGKASGNSLTTPNWHHYSLQERIDYLSASIKDPSLISKHHRRTYTYLAVYFFCLFISSWVLFNEIFI